MTQEHPITPPGELVQKWVSQMITPEEGNLALDFDWLANKAARWGADQELNACCEWLVANNWKAIHKHLRDARRPKPPSLKEQALEVLNEIESGKHGWLRIFDNLTTIRRALEQLND